MAAPTNGAARAAVALRPGSTVLICKLTDRRHLNGQEGICVRLDSATGSWHVRLAAGGDSTLYVLRPENLKELPPSAAAPRSVAPAPFPDYPDGDDPPLLAAKGIQSGSSGRAEAAARLLDGNRAKGRQLPPGGLAAFSHARLAPPLDTDYSPDAELLSMVEDEQVELDLLDGDMQLPTLGRGYGGKPSPRY